MNKNIAKLLVAIVVFISFMPYFGSSINSEKISSTHTVMAELGTVSWCPHCPVASDEIYKIFNSSNHDFYYVTLVYDKNPLALKRGRWLSDAYIPILYLDGGYKVVDNPSNYEQEITNAENRNVHDVSINVSGEWKGNAKIGVTVKIDNNEGKAYFGHLRVYVTEINSRWNDEKGLPFHYAFLDFAINNYVFVGGGKTKEIKATWDGAITHGNQTFGDIKEGNIMLVASISYWMPFIQNNPWDKPKPTHFIAQFVDDTDAAKI